MFPVIAINFDQFHFGTLLNRYAQEYLFAKPLPQEEMDEIMKQPKNWLPEGMLPVPMAASGQSFGKVVNMPINLKS